MHVALNLDQLSPYVSRSRKRAIFDVAQADIKAQNGAAIGQEEALDRGDEAHLDQRGVGGNLHD
jgi:hypothetical protein